MGGENNYFKALEDLRSGSKVPHEANTSLDVIHIMQTCLRWNKNLIHAQKHTHGVIDYELKFPNSKVTVRVEVKALDKPLNDEQIIKYLVHVEELTIGALTNLGEWWVYVAGPKVKELTGVNWISIKHILIRSRKDIKCLTRFLTYSRTGTEKRLLAITLGAAPFVIHKFLCEDSTVLKAIRTSLQDIMSKSRMEVCVPQFASLSHYVRRHLSGGSTEDCPFSRAKLRKAIGTHTVSVAIAQKLHETLGRGDVGRVKSTIRQMLNNVKNSSGGQPSLRYATNKVLRIVSL